MDAGEQKRPHKGTSKGGSCKRAGLLWNILWSVIITCTLSTILWIGFHGVPLAGLPKKEEVQSITVLCEGAGQREITDDANIELLIKAANLLNYRIGGETDKNPIITVTYHLANGEDITLKANGTTMWWHGKSHSLKEENVFVNIIRGLFFDM
ncbi:MAG: hypothetical protein HFG66_08785 [Hungatella sp.]|jgi:hypothetical protein|nr:hypothetical protein [Hungatella sp.]